METKSLILVKKLVKHRIEFFSKLRLVTSINKDLVNIIQEYLELDSKVRAYQAVYNYNYGDPPSSYLGYDLTKVFLAKNKYQAILKINDQILKETKESHQIDLISEISDSILYEFPEYLSDEVILTDKVITGLFKCYGELLIVEVPLILCDNVKCIF